MTTKEMKLVPVFKPPETSSTYRLLVKRSIDGVYDDAHMHRTSDIIIYYPASMSDTFNTVKNPDWRRYVADLFIKFLGTSDAFLMGVVDYDITDKKCSSQQIRQQVDAYLEKHKVVYEIDHVIKTDKPLAFIKFVLEEE